MSTRTAVLATLGVLVLMVVVAVVFFLRVEGPDVKARGQKLGQGMGSLGAIVLGVIWLFWFRSRARSRSR
jgi:hypothetical protein